MTSPQPFFAICKSPLPGGYQITNTSLITSADLRVRQNGTLTIVAKSYDGSTVYEGQDAINLLLAMGIQPPPWHYGETRLGRPPKDKSQGKDSIPV